jgi:hypothetical protein
LVTNFTPLALKSIGTDSLEFYNTALYIEYGSYQEFSSYQGTTSLSLSPITDTSISLWIGSFNFAIGKIYSLFFVGMDSLHIDTLLTIDTPPYHAISDSSIGVRFANLSAGSNPVSVDIKGLPPGSEVPSLSYKGITSFNSYTANADAPSSYVFEFRDAVSRNLLTSKSSFTMSHILNGTGSNSSTNNYRFRNFTIALIGIPGETGSNIQRAILIDDY